MKSGLVAGIFSIEIKYLVMQSYKMLWLILIRKILIQLMMKIVLSEVLKKNNNKSIYMQK